ncbi:hypothetical protein [Croceivirga thetidis]|uniref:Outer membrane protein beta-barrel domain-containing protein n=1 Tax=Croceivirga thetidis TaxID=2721623 RepID=A0ABX1GT20_9FLAO|nr:hypothetical protein [Croceivirga thetidis]NKI32793.1 hypothetical protein [Croceivirga thetidis]
MNRIIKILFCLSITISTLQAQNNSEFNLEFVAGLNTHGTGDIPGYQFGFIYGQSVSNKLHLQIGFEGTLNDKPDFELFYENQSGNLIDASLHTVTSGMQLIFGLKYNFVQTTNHEFGVSLLPLVRYQATSLSDSYDTLFPAITDLPFPVRNIIRIEPGRTFAVGAGLRLGYSCNFGNSLFLGINGGFQGDTNEDTIVSYFLSVGKKF